MKIMIRCVAAATILLTSTVSSQEVPELLQQARCYACHAMDATLIGPPYRAIAALHNRRADVMVEVLAQKIVNGGGGNWGVVPMVPNDHVSIEEAREMARWILSIDGKGD